MKPLRLARAACVLGLLAFAFSSPVFAEGGEGSPPGAAQASSTPAASPLAQPADPGYRGVAPGVLPPGFRKERENGLARFEIIAFGSLPLTLFYTNRGFEIYHYAKAYNDYLGEGYTSSAAFAAASAYAPWPVSGIKVASELADTTVDGKTVKNPEKFYRLGTAVGLSILVAGIDAVIRLVQDKAEERAEAERRAALPLAPHPPVGQPAPPPETSFTGIPSE